MLLLAASLIPLAAALLYAAFNNTGTAELGQIDFVHSTVNFVRGKGLDIAALMPPLDRGRFGQRLHLRCRLGQQSGTRMEE